jgi:hypothetical protein
VEQLGAWSGAERIEALPKPARKLVGSHDRRLGHPLLLRARLSMESCVCAGKKARVLLALVIAAGLGGGGRKYPVDRPRGTGTPPKPHHTIEQALTRFVTDRFGVGYVGRCPRQFPADGDSDWGRVHREVLWRGRPRRVSRGPSFSEWVGEAHACARCIPVLACGELEEYPPLGA